MSLNKSTGKLYDEASSIAFFGVVSNCSYDCHCGVSDEPFCGRPRFVISAI